MPRFSQSEPVEIPKDILEKLDSLPENSRNTNSHRWLPWEDEILRKYWGDKYEMGKKRQIDVAKILGISRTTCRLRYLELMEEDNGE